LSNHLDHQSKIQQDQFNFPTFLNLQKDRANEELILNETKSKNKLLKKEINTYRKELQSSSNEMIWIEG